MENVKISKLSLPKNNPRKISQQNLIKLSNSLQEDPEFLNKRPVLVNIVNDEYHVYAGNQRVRAAKKLGWKEVPCIIDHNLDPKIVKARTIKDNKGAGEWDFDILANEYEINDLLEWGFSLEELDLKTNPNDDDCDDSAEDKLPPQNPKTTLGDIYTLTSSDLSHTIGCGDSTDKDFVSKILKNEIPIIMVTDPPYGVEYSPEWRDKARKGTSKHGKVKNDHIYDWTEAYKLFPGNIAYVWHPIIYTHHFASHLENCNFNLINLIIWKKSNFAISRGDYHRHFEPCWYAVKENMPHNWQGSRKESDIWEIQLNKFGNLSEGEDASTVHSTQKPIQCMAKPIQNNTSKYQSVYDPFLGSGTTIIACQKLKRHCFGIDIDPAYCDIIIDRYVNYMINNNLEFEIKKNNEKIEWQVDQKQT